MASAKLKEKNSPCKVCRKYSESRKHKDEEQKLLKQKFEAAEHRNIEITNESKENSRRFDRTHSLMHAENLDLQSSVEGLTRTVKAQESQLQESAQLIASLTEKVEKLQEIIFVNFEFKYSSPQSEQSPFLPGRFTGEQTSENEKQ